jgi:hypothetical protein
LESVTKAEGGGWGVKVSASLSLMQDSESSYNSLSFTVGESNTLFKKSIRNPEALKLKPSALSLLKSNPELFLKTYGRHYISEITYGGSFLGAINLYGKTSH